MNKLRLFSLIIFTFLIIEQKIEASVDLVIFTFDRPMQLEALLLSVQKYIKGIESISCICRTTNTDYKKAYEQVFALFPALRVVYQSNKPYADFKPSLLSLTYDSLAPYVIYAVDDIIVKDYVDLTYCVDILRKTNAYGFYLRLGKNITECYTENRITPPPPLAPIEEAVYSWRFAEGAGDWAYPNTVDMTLFKKDDIKDMLLKLNYWSPNSLESAWSIQADLAKKGVCFESSKIVNLPLNLVQNFCNNRNMNACPALELLKKFEDGFRIDIDDVKKLDNAAPHVEYMPKLQLIGTKL